jgi:hypothetical protein
MRSIDMSRHGIRLALGGLLGLAAVAPAAAATFCVDPDDPAKCSATIQEAVDLAGPGDVVAIARTGGDGSRGYRENVVVTTPNLTITGKGRARGSLTKEKCPTVVLDGCETPDDPTSCGSNAGVGSAFAIDATGVTIESLTIRHFKHAVLLGDGADDTTVRGTCFVANDGAVFNDEVDDPTGSAVDRLTVERSLFRGTVDGTDVEIVGDGTIVRENAFFVTDEGVYLRGAGARVEGNEFVTCNDDCIRVKGPNTVVTENEIESADDAIELDGDNPTVTRNEVRGSDDDNVNVDCGADPDDVDPATCTGGLIADNEIVGNSDDDQGIDAEGDHLVVRDNRADGTAQAGIRYSGDNGTVTGNQIRRAGKPFFAAMEIRGDDNQVLGNKIILPASAAIETFGDRNTFRKNVIAQGGTSGFFQRDGTANVIVDNKIKGCHGEGINNALGATDTVIEDNTTTGNRTDVCNDGTIASFTGNTLDTGGVATPCLVEKIEP